MKILKQIPFLRRIIERSYIKKRFKTELALLQGNHINNSLKTSVIHFSVNKSATQYIKSILRKSATVNGMSPVSINDYAFHSTMPILNRLSGEEVEKYAHIFKPKGYVYTVFSALVGIENLEAYKILLVVRDPRDVLVSDYFSKVFSHSLPSLESDKRSDFEQRRQQAQAETIDEYVLRSSEKLYNIYANYVQHLLKKNTHVYVCRYEEMISDFEAWLVGLLNYAELEIAPELKQQFIAEHEAKTPRKEDPNQHIRKGKAGDYKIKLQAETVDNLNIKFKEVLYYFDY